MPKFYRTGASGRCDCGCSPARDPSHDEASRQAWLDAPRAQPCGAEFFADTPARCLGTRPDRRDGLEPPKWFLGAGARQPMAARELTRGQRRRWRAWRRLRRHWPEHVAAGRRGSRRERDRTAGLRARHEDGRPDHVRHPAPVVPLAGTATSVSRAVANADDLWFARRVLPERLRQRRRARRRAARRPRARRDAIRYFMFAREPSSAASHYQYRRNKDERSDFERGSSGYSNYVTPFLCRRGRTARTP